MSLGRLTLLTTYDVGGASANIKILSAAAEDRTQIAHTTVSPRSNWHLKQ